MLDILLLSHFTRVSLEESPDYLSNYNFMARQTFIEVHNIPLFFPVLVVTITLLVITAS